MPIQYRLIGKNRLYPMIEKGEYKAFDNYALVAEKFSEVENVKFMVKDTAILLLVC